MAQQVVSIPRPLVRANQGVIVISVGLTWVLGSWADWSHWILLVPFLSGLSGLLFGFNPVMKIASKLLKNLPGSYPQEDSADQRFNQILACSMLGLAFLFFLLGLQVLGYLFSAMVFAAASVALLGFCVGCFFRYQLLKARAARRGAPGMQG